MQISGNEEDKTYQSLWGPAQLKGTYLQVIILKIFSPDSWEAFVTGVDPSLKPKRGARVSCPLFLENKWINKSETFAAATVRRFSAKPPIVGSAIL